MNLIMKAARFAETAHQGQTRKFTGRPYIEHPGRVAARISRHPAASEDMVVASWLHDVLEDCSEVVTSAMRYQFSGAIIKLVTDLTNPSKQHPTLDRAAKKAMDREHVRRCSADVHRIKMADRIDNLTDAFFNGAEQAWLTQYAKESYALFTRISIPLDALTQEFRDILSIIMTANEMTEAQLKELG